MPCAQLSRRSLVFDIALGFARFTPAKAMLDNIALRFRKNSLALSRTNPIVYIFSYVVWFAYTRWGDKLPIPPARLSKILPSAPGEALAWNGKALLDALDDMVEDFRRDNRGRDTPLFPL